MLTQKEVRNKYIITLSDNGDYSISRRSGAEHYVGNDAYGRYLTVDSVGFHRLIYAYFVGDIPDGNVVSFIDGNPNNLNVDNLCLNSRSEFLAVQNKLRYKKHPGRNGSTKNLTYAEISKRQELNKLKQEQIKKHKENVKQHYARIDAIENQIAIMNSDLIFKLNQWRLLCKEKSDAQLNHDRKSFLNISVQSYNVRSETKQLKLDISSAKQELKKLKHVKIKDL